MSSEMRGKVRRYEELKQGLEPKVGGKGISGGENNL
jgi:hypothetical protein